MAHTCPNARLRELHFRTMCIDSRIILYRSIVQSRVIRIRKCRISDIIIIQISKSFNGTHAHLRPKSIGFHTIWQILITAPKHSSGIFCLPKYSIYGDICTGGLLQKTFTECQILARYNAHCQHQTSKEAPYLIHFFHILHRLKTYFQSYFNNFNQRICPSIRISFRVTDFQMIESQQIISRYSEAQAIQM